MKYDVNFIKKHEACSSKVQGKNVKLTDDDLKSKNVSNIIIYPYRCTANVWTIGWGIAHIDKDKRYDWNKLQKGIPFSECEKMFQDRIENDFVKSIDKLGLKLNKNQYTAVLSLVFNVGFGAFSISRTLKNLKELLNNIEALQENENAHDERMGINLSNLCEGQVIRSNIEKYKTDMIKEWETFDKNLVDRRKKELELFFKPC